jgi:hypothetical protein
MHHPNETDLALFAGNDLGRLARLRVGWHLRTCGKCQQEVTEFSSLRAETVRNAPSPDVNWDRLAAEMKANIRLGLEAGECIAPLQSRQRAHSPWAWVAFATAALMAVAAGGEIWINHQWSANGTAPAVASVVPLPQEVVLEVRDSGIQMRDGDSVTNELRNNNRGAVVHTVNAQGGVGARYVDRETNMVTVNNISYGQ